MNIKKYFIRKQTAIWVTAEGERIRLCDMKDSHLLNTIKFIERRAEERCNADILDASAFCFHGEQAQESHENAIDNADPDDYLPNIYYKMLDEENRRGLAHET